MRTMEPVAQQPLTVARIILLVVLCVAVLGQGIWLWRVDRSGKAPGLLPTVRSVVGSLITLVISGAYWEELQEAYPVLLGIMVGSCLSVMRVIRLALLGLDDSPAPRPGPPA